MNATVCSHPQFGCYVEFYRDDDNNSGYGANAKTAKWWGTSAECHELVAAGKTPSGLSWHAPKWEPSPHAGEWF